MICNPKTHCFTEKDLDILYRTIPSVYGYRVMDVVSIDLYAGKIKFGFGPRNPRSVKTGKTLCDQIAWLLDLEQEDFVEQYHPNILEDSVIFDYSV